MSSPPDEPGPSLDRAFAVFRAAWDKGDAPAADEFCARYPELAGLRERIDDFLLVVGALDDLKPRVSHPRRIGPYTRLRILGEGGMGTVYACRQEAPIRRDVAVKLIKLGMDTRRILARFEAERQALALMEHRFIARVFDAGATTRGQPYFAMELVDGDPITDYCAARRLGLAARVRLVCDVCAGVAHAHMKGIIHRDLKPSNILITEEDGVPVPKIIDFGLARAIDQRAGDLVQTTRYAGDRAVGTPAYMSPEQAQRGAVELDTRTDVYSLGVVLYELLAGTLPLRCGAGPSSAAAQAGPTADAELLPPSRAVEVGTIDARSLRGELDWITMRCLERERDRRYSGPAALAEDLRRFLAHEPVSAGPPTIGYRVRKALRRRRSLLLASVAMVLGLAAAVRFAVVHFEAQAAIRVLEVDKREIELADVFLAGATAAREGRRLDTALRDLLAGFDGLGAIGRWSRRYQQHWLDVVTRLRDSAMPGAAGALLSVMGSRPVDRELRGRFAEEQARTAFAVARFDEAAEHIRRWSALLGESEPLRDGLAIAERLRGVAVVDARPVAGCSIIACRHPHDPRRDVWLTIERSAPGRGDREGPSVSLWSFEDGRVRGEAVEHPVMPDGIAWAGAYREADTQWLFSSHSGVATRGSVGGSQWTLSGWRLEGLELRHAWTVRSAPKVERVIVADLDDDVGPELIGYGMREVVVLDDLYQPSASPHQVLSFGTGEHNDEDVGAILVGEDLWGDGREALVATRGHRRFLLERCRIADGRLAPIAGVRPVRGVMGPAVLVSTPLGVRAVVARSFTPHWPGFAGRVDPVFDRPGIYLVRPQSDGWEADRLWSLDESTGSPSVDGLHVVPTGGDEPLLLAGVALSAPISATTSMPTHVFAMAPMRAGATPWRFGATSGAEVIAQTADLDGDGDAEIVVSCPSRTVVMGLAGLDPSESREDAAFEPPIGDAIARAAILRERDPAGELSAGGTGRAALAVPLWAEPFDRDAPEEWSFAKLTEGRATWMRDSHGLYGGGQDGGFLRLTMSTTLASESTMDHRIGVLRSRRPIGDGDTPLSVRFAVYFERLPYASRFGARIVADESPAHGEGQIVLSKLVFMHTRNSLVIEGDRYLCHLAGLHLPSAEFPLGQWLEVVLDWRPGDPAVRARVTHRNRTGADAVIAEFGTPVTVPESCGNVGLEFQLVHEFDEEHEGDVGVAVLLDDVVVESVR